MGHNLSVDDVDVVSPVLSQNCSTHTVCLSLCVVDVIVGGNLGGAPTALLH